MSQIRKVIVYAEVSENQKTGYVSLGFKSRNSVIWIKADEVAGYEANADTPVNDLVSLDLADSTDVTNPPKYALQAAQQQLTKENSDV